MNKPKSKKNKILLFIKIPPPITGATLMNKRVYDSNILRNSFNIQSVCISYMKKRSDMGKININKAVVFIKIFFKLFIKLISFKPHLVYFQVSLFNIAFLRDFVFVLLIKIFKIKIVYHVHGKGVNERTKNKFKRFLYKYIFKNEFIISLSPLLINDLNYVYDGKIFTLAKGIPENPLKKQEIKINVNQPLKLLFLSNLKKEKGIFDFIDALCIINKLGVDFEGIIIGAEADVKIKEVKEKLSIKKISQKVKTIGPKYGKNKYEILNDSNVFIFPTYYKNESFPLVILEAMQYGLPVISTNEGAISEIIDHGENGFLVKKNSPNEIAEKLEILINNPSFLKKISSSARKKFLENYTLEKFEKNLNTILFKIFNKIV